MTEDQDRPITQQGVPVAVAIARKQQQDGIFQEGSKSKKRVYKKKPSSSQPRSPKKKTSHSKKKKHESSYEKPLSSFQLFLAGSLLYGACVCLPTAIGMLVRYYEEQHQRHLLKGNETSSSSFWWSSLTGDSTTEYMCRYPMATLDYFSVQTVPSVVSYFCPATDGTSGSLLSSDASVSDFGVVVTLSLSLALIRLAITRLLVPLQKGEQVEAMVKCKSVHLLSREYPLTPRSGTPIEGLGGQQQTLFMTESEDSMADQQERIIQGAASDPSDLKRGDGEDASSVGLRLDDSIHDDENDVGMGVFLEPNMSPPTEITSFMDTKSSAKNPPQTIQTVGQVQTSQLTSQVPATKSQEISQEAAQETKHSSDNLDDSDSLDDEDLELVEYVAAAITKSQQRTNEEPSKTASDNDRLTRNEKEEQHRLYAAPRMATALFRLIYSVAAVTLAYSFFGTTPFWPWYVGGRGSTLACWDLSGTLMLMDSPDTNDSSLLKRYFLWQASYHWHAGAFHMFSSILLLTLGQQEGKWSRWFRISTTSFTQSFVQHSLALVLIGIAYVFSSLRRLGAIGMFAFDLSSVFLHLLQLCMNTPFQLRQPKVWRWIVGFIYYGTVLTSFVFCRFVIWPLLWWSAQTESMRWLQQLEQTLFPGAAWWLQGLWNVCMVSVMTLNMIHFFRLWNHPHLKRILASPKPNHQAPETT